MMLTTIRIRFVILALLPILAFCFCSTAMNAAQVAIRVAEQEEVDEDEEDELETEVESEDDEDEDDEEFEDDADFMNNPWQVDERKLFAAKKFQLATQFAMKIKQIEDICGLDKKQNLKLKIAAKGAVEKAKEKYIKDWKKQMEQFGGFQRANGDDDEDEDDDEKKKKKKKKRKNKEFVVKDVDDIDMQVMQMLDQSFIGGVQKKDFTDIPMWKRTVKKVLSEEQQEKLGKHNEKVKLAKRAARADSFVAEMRMKLALSDEQVKEFDELVRPAFLEKDMEVAWHYDTMATLYLGSKHDKKKMKKLLSKDQKMVLDFALKPAESYAGMFGDNVGAVQVGMAVEFDPVGQFFEGFIDFLGGFADFVEEAVEGVFVK